MDLRGRGRRAWGTTGGFTLMEVLLVVVIILIASGVAVPRLRGTFQHTQMQDATRSTLRMARFARSMAIVRQETCVLTIHTNRIELTIAAAGTNAAQQIVRRFPDDITLAGFESPARPVPGDSGTGHPVRFFPAGMNDGFELTLRDARDRRMLIRCNPITGRTTVEEKR